jgi:hypothetical protein
LIRSSENQSNAHSTLSLDEDKNPLFESMTTKSTKMSQSKLCSSSELFVGFVNHVVGIAHLRFLRHDFIIKHKELAFKFMLEFLKDLYSEQWNTLTQSLWSEVWEHTSETFSNEKKKKIQQHYDDGNIHEGILKIYNELKLSNLQTSSK